MFFSFVEGEKRKRHLSSYNDLIKHKTLIQQEINFQEKNGSLIFVDRDRKVTREKNNN